MFTLVKRKPEKPQLQTKQRLLSTPKFPTATTPVKLQALILNLSSVSEYY